LAAVIVIGSWMSSFKGRLFVGNTHFGKSFPVTVEHGYICIAECVGSFLEVESQLRALEQKHKYIHVGILDKIYWESINRFGGKLSSPPVVVGTRSSFGLNYFKSPYFFIYQRRIGLPMKFESVGKEYIIDHVGSF
jgi:hypothetical protein